MKKVLSLILALTLVFAMAVPALADGISQNTPTKTGSVVVSTSVGVAYTVTIPVDAAIVANATTTDIGDIVLSGAVLAPGKSVTVAVSGGELTSEGLGSLAHNVTATTKLPFTMKIDGTGANSTSFTANGTKQVDIDITAEAWGAAPAGSYSATLTFTVSYDG